ATSEGEVVCDCTDLEFLDSSGISMLVEVHYELAQLGRDMRLINVIGAPRRCVQVCGMTEYFRITDEAPLVLTPPAITMLRHLVTFTVVGARAHGVGLPGAVARDALNELEAAGYARRVKMPMNRDPMFVVTAAGRRMAAGIAPGAPACS